MLHRHAGDDLDNAHFVRKSHLRCLLIGLRLMGKDIGSEQPQYLPARIGNSGSAPFGHRRGADRRHEQLRHR